MSDDYLKIIPSSTDFVPAKKTHKAAIALLESFFPDGEEFAVEVYDDVEFIDQGENLEAVICPACHKRLNLDHSSEEDPNVAWWNELSEAFGEQPLGELMTRMSCCQKEVRVIDLDFDWPAGCARFELSVMNPNVTENLDESQLLQIEKILGCPLQQVRAHY